MRVGIFTEWESLGMLFRVFKGILFKCSKGVTQSNLGSFRVSGFSVTATHLVNSWQVFYHYNINAGTIFTETVQTKKIELSVLTLCFTLEFLCPHVPTENYYILM